MNTYSLIRHGRKLRGHTAGKTAFVMVLEALRASGKDQVFQMDMEGIEALDYTFAAPFFTSLLQGLGTDLRGYHVVLINCSSYVEAHLDTLLTQYGLVIMSLHDERWTLIGAYVQKDIDVLTSLARLKTATISELARHLGVGASSCQKRLSRLLKMGLVGRQRAEEARAPAKYVYSSIV